MDRTDVAVIGGGIAGVSALYHLARAGVDAVLLERNRIGSGATAAAVGVLLPPLRQPFHETVRFRGRETADRLWRYAFRSVEGLCRVLEDAGASAEVGLDRSGAFVLAEPETLDSVAGAHAALEATGFPVSWLGGEMVAGLVRNGDAGRDSVPFVGGYRIEGGGCIDGSAAARVLARQAVAHGARVAEDREVRAVKHQGGRLRCLTSRGQVECEMVVYATHTDARRFSSFLGDEVVPLRGQAMRGTAPDEGAPAGGFSTAEKRNEWCACPGGGVRLGGWRPWAWDRAYWKLRPEVDEELQQGVQRWFEDAVLGGASLGVEERWSGIFGLTADHVPLAGALPGRTRELVVAGFGGGGLAFAFEAGRTVAAAIAGSEPPPGSDLLNPRRFA